MPLHLLLVKITKHLKRKKNEKIQRKHLIPFKFSIRMNFDLKKNQIKQEHEFFSCTYFQLKTKNATYLPANFFYSFQTFHFSFFAFEDI